MWMECVGCGNMFGMVVVAAAMWWWDAVTIVGVV